jgi:hypothetical protein
MRRDATIYDVLRTDGKTRRGRPRKKGKKLLKPQQMAKRIRNFKLIKTSEHGKSKQRLPADVVFSLKSDIQPFYQPFLRPNTTVHPAYYCLLINFLTLYVISRKNTIENLSLPNVIALWI